jgi:hypothetical protein
VTLVVNLLGRSGVGKSGLAGAIVGKLKARHFLAEQVTEFAKSLILDGNIAALRNQAFVLGNQYHWVERCIGKTDIVVTDSPTLLSSIYAPPDYPQSFHDFVLWTHHAHDCVNFFLRRNDGSAYQNEARVHDEADSHRRELLIEQLLTRHGIHGADRRRALRRSRRRAYRHRDPRARRLSHRSLRSDLNESCG